MNSFQPEQQLIQIFIVNNDDLKKAIEKKKRPELINRGIRRGVVFHYDITLLHYIITGFHYYDLSIMIL